MAYTRTFVMDGNFSTVHQNREKAHRNIKLSHSEFFMTDVKCWVWKELARESDGSPSEGTEGSPVGYRGNSQGNPMEV